MSQARLDFSAGDDWLSCLPLSVDEDPDGLRWMQREAYDAVLADYAEGFRALMTVMATGIGKTNLLVNLAKYWDKGDVLILANRDELVSQASVRYTQTTGEYCEIEKSDQRSSNRARVVVGSVQSFNQKRLERLGRNRFGLVIADEVHNFLAPTYQRALDWFDCCRYGTTATPDRGDGKALAGIIDKVSYSFDIEDGIEDGYLVNIVGSSVKLDEVDLSDVASKKVDGVSDLDQAQLDDKMLRACEGIVHETLRLYPERQGIAFFPGIKSASYAAEKFNVKVPGSACFISGETDPDERRLIVADFKKGRYKYLCNCNVATEGFDAPSVSLIIQGRPTKSRKFYAQTTGRGTRVLPGVVDHLPRKDQASDRRTAVLASAKPDCVILDFVGNAGKHSLMTPEDMLGGRYSEDEVKLAKKIRAKEGATDVSKALKRAREQLAAKARATQAKVTATVKAFNPFKLFGEADVNDKYVMKYGDTGPSERTVAYLLDLGLAKDQIATMNRKGASKFLEDAAARQAKGLATYKQIKTLSRFGVDAANVTKERASLGISYLSDCGWGSKGKIDVKAFETLVFGARVAGEEG